jgi:cytochrome c-type protein NrfB
MRSKIVLIVTMSMTLFFSSAFSEQNFGAENIILEGGESGVVPFPHKRHQDTLKDCNICHELFDREIGSIEQQKVEDRLKAKQVMNTQCLKCHRDTKKAGKASGPISCATCHTK